jgi:hypothetical protein
VPVLSFLRGCVIFKDFFSETNQSISSKNYITRFKHLNEERMEKMMQNAILQSEKQKNLLNLDGGFM